MNLEINLSKLFFGYGLQYFLVILTGPLIPELFLLCSYFFLFFLSSKTKKFDYFKNKYFIFFLIFYLSTFFQQY